MPNPQITFPSSFYRSISWTHHITIRSFSIQNVNLVIKSRRTLWFKRFKQIVGILQKCELIKWQLYVCSDTKLQNNEYFFQKNSFFQAVIHTLGAQTENNLRRFMAIRLTLWSYLSSTTLRNVQVHAYNIWYVIKTLRSELLKYWHIISHWCF